MGFIPGLPFGTEKLVPQGVLMHLFLKRALFWWNIRNEHFFSGTFRSIPGLGQPYMLLLQPFGEFGVDFCLFASFPGQCHKDTLLIKVACVSH